MLWNVVQVGHEETTDPALVKKVLLENGLEAVWDKLKFALDPCLRGLAPCDPSEQSSTAAAGDEGNTALDEFEQDIDDL